MYSTFNEWKSENQILAIVVIPRFWNDSKLLCVPENSLVECDDHVEVNGVVFNKPFVEKPVSAEDHNIYMYYPASAGEFQSFWVFYCLENVLKKCYNRKILKNLT